MTVVCANRCGICLLYTSDAADEEDSVDLGGRRIIKKNSLLTHHVGYKAHNRRGVCPNFKFFSPIFPNLSYSMHYVGSEAVTDVVDNNPTSALAS